MNSKQLYVRSGSAPVAGVGDAGDRLGASPTTRRRPRSRASVDLAVEVLDQAAHVVAARLRPASTSTLPPGKKRSVRRTAPTFRLRAAMRLAALADQQLGRTAADVDEQQAAVEHRHRLEHAEVDQPGLLDPRDHLDVRRRPPSRARSMNSRALVASRVALVATARTVGVEAVGDAPAFAGRQATPRSSASGVSSFMSPPPEPSRTTSRSRVNVSKPSRRPGGRRRGGCCSSRCRSPPAPWWAARRSRHRPATLRRSAPSVSRRRSRRGTSAGR